MPGWVDAPVAQGKAAPRQPAHNPFAAMPGTMFVACEYRLVVYHDYKNQETP
jgi:hypothetical protein